MAITTEVLERVFKHGKIILPDPDPSMAPKDVMIFYSGQYPELTNAELSGPKVENDKINFEFGKTVGTKG